VDDLTVVEGGTELLDAVEPLWLSMFEWHVSLPPEAAAVAHLREPREALRRRFDRFRRELGEGRVTLYLVREGDQPVAFALTRRRPEGEASFDTGDDVAELEAMAVTPEHRGRGLGSALLRRVHESLAEQGVGYLSLTVMAGNERAERFYRGFGMVPSQLRMLGPVRGSQGT
jgi:ribosomal protein S18 acetylase RimI-like enzyme